VAGHYHSNAAAFRRDFAAETSKRVKAASAYLSSQVKADVSQPGTLRYHPLGKGGRALKSQKTVYNFTHSRPGNPPFKQTGNLRKSIAYEVSGLVGRVGSNIKKPNYALYLELGTRRMAARPYLRAALLRNKWALRRLLGVGKAGPLPAVSGNQYRPGHFGRGASAAGWGG
jgi:hypothetical protein